jgi:hypothetical protein
MKRMLAGFVTCAIVTGAIAMPSFLTVFKAKYKVAANSNLGKARCMICHRSQSGVKLNPYGADLKRALHGSKRLTYAVLAKVEGLDSTRSGKTNLAKIKADKLPGR